MAHSDELNVIGKRQPRFDGAEKCSGKSVFGDDVQLPGMLCGKILRSPFAHARILSVDTSKAEALPGVKVVITAKDAEGIMGTRRGTEPVFIDLPDNVVAGRHLKFELRRRWQNHFFPVGGR